MASTIDNFMKVSSKLFLSCFTFVKHFKFILSLTSHTTDLDIRSIKTLGDTLHDKGFLYAGQFCYLMAELEFGSYANKNSKLVLIGGMF